MWMKSVSKFVSKFSQNYEFKATDKPRFGKNVSSVICLHKIEYLMYRHGRSSPHIINTGLQLDKCLDHLNIGILDHENCLQLFKSNARILKAVQSELLSSMIAVFFCVGVVVIHSE
jgi:hypothetical protein